MEINVIPVGEWDHPNYGKMKITEEDIGKFIQNFDANLRKGVPITEGHPTNDEELPAVGWFKELINKGSEGLWAVVEWTKQGRQLLEEKAYKYFSPEFYRDYEDPESRKSYKNVLTGGALTNMPYFKGLQAIVMSEAKIYNQFKKITMNIEEILKKDVADLTDEDKEAIKTAELTDDQKDKYKDVLKTKETDEEKEAREKKEKEDEEEKKKKEAEGGEGGEENEGGDKTEGSEKSVKISAGEFKILTDKADQGAEAMKQLTETKIAEIASTYQFSESNKNGKFLPKSKEKVVDFMMSLSQGQREKFQEILSELPKVQLFGEIGDIGSEKKVEDELEEAVIAKQKEDTAMTYSDAVKVVLSENKDLAKKYSEKFNE
jgi:hypothetical protein